MESQFVRCFVAIGLDDRTREQLVGVQTELRATRAHVSWVRPENIHLSLVFLGDVLRDDVPAIVEVIDDAVSSHAPFSFEVCGTGSFGRGSPRVIWAGVRGCDALAAVQAAVSGGLRGVGIELEQRPYRPHITLGRVRSARGRRVLISALEELPDRHYGTVSVKGVDLMRSRLKPTGAEYGVLHHCALAGPGPAEGPRVRGIITA